MAAAGSVAVQPGCACGLVDAIGGATLEFPGAPAGTYRLEVEAEAEVVAVEVTWRDGACAPVVADGARVHLEGCSTWGGTTELSLLVSDPDLETGPRAVTVRVFRDGALIATAQPALRYHDVDPNGAFCDPHVEQARAAIALP